MGSYRNENDSLSDGAAIVAGYYSSGLTRADYCRRIGISVHKLDYHQRRARAGKLPCLLPVQISAGPTPANPELAQPLALVLRNGRKLELTWRGPSEAFPRWLAMLEQD